LVAVYLFLVCNFVVHYFVNLSIADRTVTLLADVEHELCGGEDFCLR
jgi:hypothetical protein